MALTILITAFRDGILYSLVDVHRRFGGIAARSSETLINTCQTTQHHIAKESNFYFDVILSFTSRFLFSLLQG
jgi:hypothetical protein